MRYSVEQVDVERARDDLLRIWRENLPVRGSCERKFAWTYEHAPVTPLSPFLLVARRGADRLVVGSAGVARRAFVVAGQPACAGVLADLAVDRDHRTALPALALVRRARSSAREHVHLVYGFPNRKAAPVFLRAGYATLGTMIRHVRVLRHTSYARRFLRWGPAARASGLAADAGALAVRLPARMASAARYELAWSEAADERVLEVWSRAAPSYRVVGVRDPEFLDWRLSDHPGGGYRFAWLRDKRGDAVSAYAAIARHGEQLVVRDFFGVPEELPPLFEKLAAWGRAAGARCLSLRFLGDPRVLAALRKAGFQPREDSRTIVVDAASEHQLVFDPANWYLTDADEDA